MPGLSFNGLVAARFRKAEGVLRRGYVLTLTGQATKAVEMVACGIDLWRSAGSTIFTPEQEFMLAIAHADSGQFDDAWSCIGKAMTAMNATKERWCEAEAHRVAAGASTAGKVVGIARRHEPGATLERSGKTANGTRPSRPHLRLVHRRF